MIGASKERPVKVHERDKHFNQFVPPRCNLNCAYGISHPFIQLQEGELMNGRGDT